MDEAKPLPTSATSGKILSKRDGDLMAEPSIYRRTIGALQYVTMTRPNIAYMVSKLSQFLQNPTNVHRHACKRVLRSLLERDHHPWPLLQIQQTIGSCRFL